jgi:hypothetical protein
MEIIAGFVTAMYVALADMLSMEMKKTLPDVRCSREPLRV